MSRKMILYYQKIEVQI